MKSLPVWLPGPIFLLGGLYPWPHVSSGQGLCPGSVEGFWDPPSELEKRAVRILLECFLVWLFS